LILGLWVITDYQKRNYCMQIMTNLFLKINDKPSAL
jgi:hypothetical protein